MSMDGDVVLWKSRRRSYTPVRMKSVSTLLALDAQISRPTGRPIRRANSPARMSPKLPVGTAKFTASPGRIAPRATRSA